MTRRVRPSALLALVIAPALAVGWLVAPTRDLRAAAPAATPWAWTAEAPSARLAAWTGEVQLYRGGTFTTQQSWLWCTAAGVQIARNIVHGETDHRTSAQRRYFEWMRDRNRYDLPVSAGVDPAGWTAGMRHFVDDRYRLVSSRTFDDALRSAVLRIRQTSLPVAITVSHGGHGWLLVGFAATADPAATRDFEVSSVRVVGPLWGLQSKNGYDMRPNTRLTTAQLKRFLTAWHYDPLPMVWDGRFVSIQPIPGETAAVPSARPSATPQSTLDPTPQPTPSPLPSPSPSPTPASSAVPSVVSPDTSAPGPDTSAPGIASPASSDLVAAASAGPAGQEDVGAAGPTGGLAPGIPVAAMAAVALVAVAVGSLLAIGLARRRR